MSETANGKSKSRRHFGDDQKAAIVRRHLADKVPVSDLSGCRKLNSRVSYDGNSAILS